MKPVRPRRYRSPGARDPWLWAGRALAVVAVLAGLALIGVAYELGLRNAGYNRLAAGRREAGLRSQLLKQQSADKELRERIASLETAALVKAEAYRQVEGRLEELQARIQQQSEQLAFYQGIVGADQQAGLRVQDLEVLADEQPGTFSLRLVLAQALRSDRRISGRVELVVQGQQDGVPTSLSLAELTPDHTEKLHFSFRYFQNLTARLSMPEGFSPARVTVRLVPRGAKRKDVEKSFDWPVARS